jgi:RNA polymerase sigma factor (TIGR02999 family)
MQPRSQQEVEFSLTEQLQRLANGDRLLADTVLNAVWEELHHVAERALRQERRPALCATELINEVWLRKLGKGGWRAEDRQHFYAIAAFAMRQVLVEFARRHKAERRGGAMVILPLNGLLIDNSDADPETLIAIGILMDRLERKDASCARVVDLHYFAGFTLEEIAQISGLTPKQVRRLWEKGRDWLKDGLAR